MIHLALNGVREHRRRLKFLIDATATFDTSLDPAEALRNLAQAAVPELAELCVIDLLDRDGSIERHGRRRRSTPRSPKASSACAGRSRSTSTAAHPVAARAAQRRAAASSTT